LNCWVSSKVSILENNCAFSWQGKVARMEIVYWWVGGICKVASSPDICKFYKTQTKIGTSEFTDPWLQELGWGGEPEYVLANV
jgi:hypothetical protein